MLPVILFYLFSVLAIIAGVAVISARNPVHSVLFLIFAFFNVAGLFILLGAEFLAMLLVIVYVGAVAVLFLFIVMMLNVDTSRLRAGFIKSLPIGIIIAAILFAEIFIMMDYSIARMDNVANAAQSYSYNSEEVTNTEILGLILYTDYAFVFQLAGLILLVAMIGAIVLTHRVRPNVRKQKIVDQVMRDPKKAVRLVKVESGQGVE